MNWLMRANSQANPDLQVVVDILTLNDTEPIRQRSIILQSPEWSIPIGRGSATEPDLNPTEGNCWFTSRVMSRNHAVLRANPISRALSIEDVGSMHGTLLDGAPVARESIEILDQGSIITFGTQVVRGPDSYNPLQVRVSFEWSDGFYEEENMSVQEELKSSGGADFSDDDIQSEYSDDVDMVMESVQQPRLEVLIDHPKTFRVPDDDSSSIVSMDEESIPDDSTSPSDPTELSEEDNSKEEHHDMTNTELSPLMSDQDIRHDVQFIAENDDLFSEDEEELLCKESEINTGQSGPVQAAQVAIDHGHERSCLSIPPLSYILREPSPSDAAMAKPFNKTTQTNPLRDDTKLSTTSGSKYTCESFYTPQNDSKYSSLDQSHTILMPPLPSDVTVPLTNAQFPPPVVESSWGNHMNIPSFAQLLAGPTDTTTFTPAPLPATNITDEQLQSNHQNKLKRKADQMADDDAEETPVESIVWLNGSNASPLSDLIEHTVPDTIPNMSFDLVTDKITNDGTTEPLEETGQASEKVVTIVKRNADEPLRKKAKTKAEQLRQQGTGSGLARYAASALAGAAFGVIGTVVGLAALPTDFFN